MKLIINQAQGKFKTLLRLLRFSFLFFCALSLNACLDLVQDSAAPCGGPDDCSSPRQCIMNRCVAACYSDEDCAQTEKCMRQICVSSQELNASESPNPTYTAGESMAGESTAGESMAGESTAGESMAGEPTAGEIP